MAKSGIVDESELMLELSIGGIFGESKNTNRNTRESVENADDLNVESKREIQAIRRRELRRKREEKVKKSVGFGSFVENNEWLETQIVKRNDDVLEIEPVRKKERIGDSPENVKSCVFRPTPCRSFRPYEGKRNVKCVEDEIEGGGCASSAFSDSQCSYRQGGATDDSRSNSSDSQLDQQLPTTSAASDPLEPSDQPTSSFKQTGSTTRTNPNPPDPNPPPRPDTTNPHASLLARMPCVSTTGNGPDGRTVSGFLYRYTKNEVSIVCVCHGSSFSPAGFVEHAGGVDIVNPLKHITIFPTTFGS